MATIRLEGVSLIRSGVPVLAGFDLQVGPGEHVALVGPSGAGKTSILALVAGQLRPDTGRVRVEGVVASIHQDFRLVGSRSALENALDGLRAAHGLHAARLRRGEAEALLRRLGLGERLQLRADRLSGGEQQRVAIARALLRDAQVLLADEPTSALDAASGAALMDLLDELRRERGLTILSVLHDHALASAHADRIVAITPNPEGELASAPPTALPRAFAEAAARDDERADGHRWWLALGTAAVALLCALALHWLQLSWPQDGVLGQLLRFTGQLWPARGEWAGIPWTTLGRAVLDTLAMALLATVVAVFIALPLSATAARSISPPWLALPVRGLLNALRAVPSLLWALLAVGAFGLGPLAGIAALCAYSLGYLTKFFYEHFEAVDPHVPEALRALGLGRFATFRLADLPAARLGLLSSSVFMLEYNFRTATVLGIVGAGGIGFELKLAVDWGNWHVVGVIIVLLVLAVVLFDTLAHRLRRAAA